MALETNSERIARQRREAGGINGPRTDGAVPSQGYSRFRQGGNSRNFSNLDAFYANQRGAPSSGNPAFAGLTPEEIAMEMKRRGETTGPGGNTIVPDTRMPPRTRPAVGSGQPPAAGVSGEGTDVPLSDTGGYVNSPGTEDPFKGVKPAGAAPAPAAPAAPTAPQPVDPSTVRQPVGMLDPENTPAARRQMASDAAMGRTVSTTGTTGLGVYPTSDPSQQTQQAADYRRMITSKYGTGTNVTRTPGQGPAMTADVMGRPALMRQYLKDRREIQATPARTTNADVGQEDDQEAA